MVRHSLVLGLLPVLAAASPVPPQSTLTDCLQAFGVPAVFQSSADFNDLATPLNLRMKSNSKPAVITLPTNTQHVSRTIKCAKQFGIKVTTRGGGHSYNAQCLGPNAAVVDLRNFHDVVYDPKTQLVRVGGGARLGNVAQKLYDQAKRGLPHGTCPDVGIGGHANGGFGWVGRMWGLTVDQTVEVEVVTADGQIRRANKSHNSDLFWALRGASPSFGVITNFWFKTYEAPENNIAYSYKWKTHSVAQAAASFLEIQKFAQNAPKELGLLIDIWTYDDGFRLYGAYFGKSQQEFDALFAPLMEKLPKPDKTEVSMKRWIETLVFAAESSTTITVPELGGTKLRTAFYSKNLLRDAPLSLEELKTFFTFAFNQARTAAEKYGFATGVYVSLAGGGNNIFERPELLNESSFGQRSALWYFEFYTMIKNLTEASNAQAIDFNTKYHASVWRPTDAAYLNGHDPQLSREEAHKVYYGSQNARLSQVKKVWDNDQLFWYPQSIEPSA
ncbi:hypothetical protein TWF694_006387 [Orbilia ellipsospora]|uniref:FAD-binding PCMH-type domain-containing protein n=1 Tax=Orbilia ellipsospora TaxID=2528407 RepID=A0AAV9XKD3_9PEZI